MPEILPAEDLTDQYTNSSLPETNLGTSSGQYKVPILYQGRFSELNRGIGKGGVRNPDEAAILLGIAYLKAGNKPEAAKAFQTVNQDPTLTRVAKLWLLNT